ncbi:hypothetical protein [Allorhodopirellula heiligendammensis]|uniref:Uncharacterized protein n=1 Tax=Allorhodopirellula heiligendammensis TaxID=2714739 RepID=A0A5C6BEH7_9BACT|nr:hypothetical protein [Allorhodopirellula heiligendammensis]TWU09891.1 hypothetical protein Poly21_54400 [Allorhodopirellula heiligendammensis]
MKRSKDETKQQKKTRKTRVKVPIQAPKVRTPQEPSTMEDHYKLVAPDKPKMSERMSHRLTDEVLRGMTKQQAKEHVITNWEDLSGSSEEGMAQYKLHGRMDKISWNSPILTFSIERHGGLVMGSSRADVHYWKVNLKECTAEIERKSYRQIDKMAPRVRIAPIVDEIVAALLSGSTDERIEWKENGEAHVLTSKQLFPGSSGYSETVGGRRRNFRDKLKTRLAEVGWTCEHGRGIEICTRLTGNHDSP